MAAWHPHLVLQGSCLAEERGRPSLDPPSGKNAPCVGTWAIKSGWYLWSLFFISVITFYGL